MVRVAATGVCHSDYNLVDGFRYVENLPMVMGHEASGVVEQVGPGVPSSWAGGPCGVQHPPVVRGLRVLLEREVQPLHQAAGGRDN